MKQEILNCDKCKVLIKEGDKFSLNLERINSDGKSFFLRDQFDLCLNCEKEFLRYFNFKKKTIWSDLNESKTD